MDVFGQFESDVRYYVRKFPDVFVKAKGAHLFGRSGRDYIDFFSGAGALNYGHNDDGMKQALIAYLGGDGVVHSLDMATDAKEAFLQAFHDVILAPRGMNHRMLFPGPAGTNAVEAALKLARKATGRLGVIAFENAFHGMSLGAMAVSGGPARQSKAAPPVGETVFLPFDGAHGGNFDTLELVERHIRESVDLPAACIVETVQADGGVIAASAQWLSGLQAICRTAGVALIVDDVQVGCGRTGPFFSFEAAGLDPDIVCLSKSLSGLGLPLSMVLVKPAFDRLAPGEHTGTFRGFVPAFVTGLEALRFWRDDTLEREVGRLAGVLRVRLERIVAAHPQTLLHPPRGRGLIQGIAAASTETAARVQKCAFARGLILETVGRDDDVLKILCPLTIQEAELGTGLERLEAAIGDAEASALSAAPSATARR